MNSYENKTAENWTLADECAGLADEPGVDIEACPLTENEAAEYQSVLFAWWWDANEGPVTKTLQKKVSLGKPYYGATISREQGLTIKRSDGASEAVLNSDIFSMRAKNAAGQMIDCIYFDALAQLYRITGQVEIDGALVTQNMYADEGDIVALTVDHLMTSRRVSKYITGDTTNDNHIDIRGNVAKWIVAAVKTSDGSLVTVPLFPLGGEFGEFLPLKFL